jgi:hypothetical protein
LTSIRPCSLKDFFGEVHTVHFFTPRHNDNNKKYSTKRSDAHRRSGTPFGRQRIREMAYSNVRSSSEEQRA